MIPTPANECPEPLRLAFLDLLEWTLVTIRNNSTDSHFCLALSDHMHNVPALLANFHPDLLAYYWKVERLCFLRDLEAAGRQYPGYLDELWDVVEDEYRRLCKPSDV